MADVVDRAVSWLNKPFESSATKIVGELVEYVRLLETALGQQGHRAVIGERGWSMEHPVECRPNMHECPLHDAMHVACEFGPPVAPGTYDLWQDEFGELHFEREAGDAA